MGDANFKKWIAVDWSGAGSDTTRSDNFGVACWSFGKNEPSFDKRRFSRQEILKVLSDELHSCEPCLIGLDFGFGYPMNGRHNAFGQRDWFDLCRYMRKRHEKFGTAYEVAKSVNSEECFQGHGPFRFQEDRNDHRFYVANGVPYFRLTEQFAPQATSQWWLGPHPVGMSTITGLACLGYLLEQRSKGDFAVFPFEIEAIDATRHVIAEIYPALYPASSLLESKHVHRRDAEKSVRFLHENYKTKSALRLPSISGIDSEVIRRHAFEEGWILGIGC